MEKGVSVWLRDLELDEWQRATVVKLGEPRDGDKQREVTLRLTEGPNARTEKTLQIDVQALEEERVDGVMLANSSDMDVVEDLIQLPHLHEPGICHTLNERFKINEIYTLTGEILLAINPFQNLGIYTDKITRKYIRNGDKRALGQEVPDMPPHVFSIADKAYRSLVNPIGRSSNGGPANQSILVSGESGAGKTETTKFVMNYLATISQHKNATADSNVMKQVLSSNPILESFGNARTIRNDNSSRFGKFIKMEFSPDGSLIGASIQTYLLEKVRLAYQGESERNYHVFYEIIAGATVEEKKRWNLKAPTKFHYLNQSTCTKRKDGVNDADQFMVLKNAMQTMGFDNNDMESIFVTISALLHIGNLEFDETHQASGTEGSEISMMCEDSMKVVLDFLEVDKEGLEQAICNRNIQTKEEHFSIGLLPDAAENARDALARFLYGKLFDWLVIRINDIVENEDRDVPFIGLLDIFGFEDLEHNSFEQLCINFANETLQQHFNLTVLRMEQETYEKEEIQWSFINFPDNGPCIELIQGRPFGILPALDEECIVPQGNDQNFSRKLYRQHASNPHFSANKSEMANHLFVVHHYAGAVTYDTFGFCEKNKDILYPEITAIISRSSKPFVRGLLQVVSERKTPIKKAKGRATSVASRMSLGLQFRNQLKVLLETINVTDCHYVRCLKPNDLAKANLLIAKRVCLQLKAGGVLEAVRVNRAGYPVRITHQQFIHRYRPLANGEILKRIPPEAAEDIFDSNERKEAASLLVKYLLRAHAKRYPELAGMTTDTVAGIQVGLTRVFFRRSAIQFVEAQLAKRYGDSSSLRSHADSSSCSAEDDSRFHYSLADIKQRQKELAEIQQREIELAEKKKKGEERLAAEKQLLLDEKRKAAQLEEQNRLTAQSASSDPVSDDSSEGDRGSSMKLPRYSGESRGRAVSRFRFTKDYDDDDDDMPNASRQVAMDPGDTVLHVAANCCNEQDVLKLLQNGSDINARNRRGRTPLHTASLYQNVEVVGILLDWEADVLVQDNDGNTPLHLTKDPRIARLLLEAGCTPNIVNADGRTALINAVDAGDDKTVKLLLHFKADVLFRELKHHQTALHLAVRKGQYQIVMDLCKSEDIKELILLTDRNENNALHFAVSRDRKNGYRLVDYLIKHGAEVDKVNARFQSPLVVHIMTTRQTDPAITELLLKRGADFSIQLADGSTLLHVAVERELIDIACALIKQGASLNEPDAKGRLVVEVANKKYLKKLFSAITQPPTWINEKERRACMLCSSSFKFGTRRHHCRHCGRVCCSDCSAFTVEMHQFPKDFPGRTSTGGKQVKDPQRVCRTCHAVFKMRLAQKESKSGFMARVLGYEWDEVTATNRV
ncbi:myosin-like protein [Plasmopara halstedii]|uniref:Myosin-like protein n=1 Tax=Plasmopara halstedii TaxID=4781 RepID=A0A0N7L5Z6_PLAHL|nr:myosin-like protein [Plasmopara halstedii]CEG42859.1 myosin-like protein [Plasmopara halstedii]|eukprot:XP_024579228.1 myosin-like protein [Plasmopara halstedii]